MTEGAQFERGAVRHFKFITIRWTVDSTLHQLVVGPRTTVRPDSVVQELENALSFAGGRERLGGYLMPLIGATWQLWCCRSFRQKACLYESFSGIDAPMGSVPLYSPTLKRPLDARVLRQTFLWDRLPYLWYGFPYEDDSQY